MYKGIYITLFFIICCFQSIKSQELPDPDSTIVIPKNDTLRSIQDTFSTMRVLTAKDTIIADKANITAVDSIPTLIDSSSFIDFSNVKLSDSGLDAEINYGGDSTWYDATENKYHLYGIPGKPAFVNYQDLKLTAGYIIFDIDNDIAEAFYRLKNGQKIEQPTFEKGENIFKYSELRFNFKTQKGIVTDAITQNGEFFLHGAKTKFISKDSDSTMLDDEIFNTDAIITTCNHDQPHWGIRTKKLKIVPNKLAIIGFSQIEIAGIPTPFVLPFGFFPLVKGQSSGLIFPKDYEFDKDFGLGFREIGYYFPINDYMDLRLTGDIYTRGTYRVRARTNYAKRYAYSGDLNLGYSSNRVEDSQTGESLRNTSISINLSHRQDAKAHPYRKIDGSINIQTDNYQKNNFNDANSQLNNRLRSNFNFTHSMPGTPFSFRMGMSHDQNNRTRQVNINLPEISLNMNTIFPFRRKGASDKKWFEEISLRYDVQAKNRIEATDTTLFTSQTLDDMRSGVSHRASSSASFNVAKYFSFTPSVSYQELWFFTINNQEFNPAPILDTIEVVDDGQGNLIYRTDTIYGEIIKGVERGFYPVRTLNSGFSLNTQIFGTKRFSRGFLRGIRHTIKPSVSFNFSPDSKSKYYRTVDTDSRDEFNNPVEFNPYLRSPVGSASLGERQMAVNFSINNIFEGKYYSKKDSTEKNFKILNSLSIRGGYNFAADSLNWSNLSFSGNTRLFGLSNLQFNGTYSPYAYKDGRITSQTMWSVNKQLLNFRSFQVRLNTDFSFSDIRDIFRGKKEEKNNQGGNRSGSSSSPQNRNNSLQSSGFTEDQEESDEGIKREISILDLFQSFRISHNLVYRMTKQRDGSIRSQISTNTLTIRGNVPLTEKWKMRLGNISYDFKNKSLVYPSIGLSRDLHCWEMSFDWRPSNGVYSFYIGVKPGTFSFIKYNYGQGNPQNFFGR